jgi:hypothetical protein
MSEQEKLCFKIGLSGSKNTKKPEFKIAVNGKEYVHKTLSSDETEYFEFTAIVNEGECDLIISLLNKEDYDTIQDEQGNIVSDMLLNIESVEIDEIDLGTLLWTLSKYRPIYSQSYIEVNKKLGKNLPNYLDNCVNLGWKGDWILKFTSPFYIWLLENI